MHKKSSPNVQTIIKKRKKITQSYLENAGAYYLQRFSASTSQFKKVMERKIDLSCRDHPDQNQADCINLLENVVIKFIQLGYLDDKNYARIVFSNLQNRGFSFSRVMMTLRQKGISPEIIEQILPEKTAGEHHDDDRKAALIWARKKKLGPFAIRHRDNDMNRGLSSLARAGFGYDIANWVMNLSSDEAKELL